ncbi:MULTISPECIES: L-fuculose-phosphate aldolase [unclassified Streptococcus]|uniref:L-fuculose-phosphate aldolase n=1 Tax=unclassified Streptococcus TaxID=2608887 RepID=UPI001072CDAE|nr:MULTISPECIES: L-fuculose-phosphate aldolase [unclassified Streptococcus]MBF0787313.1 L-fuculose-phosphate aldolase [Streptococcus sp. 19428wC2_LYSM12]MCQ9212652.1 L-fuculose-phosphate aldolase [Streptococcus sp. B01]MCQ9213991.1 L-fuculose-phosphate aldolase [Streptococcus sp. O1]TFV05800.1 L-fuculose-phosphate aldolase [Streptococcus sp. LYSM12]
MTNIRQELIQYGKKLVETDLTKGTGGNLSVFDREKKQMAITPSGIDFFDIKEEDIVIMDMDGHVVEGHSLPSSEWYMHLIQYQTRDDIDAIIHAHTTYATVLACLREPLPATHYMIAVAGKDVRVADYATYGTKELAVNAAKAMENRRAVLLANHGILAGAKDLLNAFNIVEEVEYCSKIYCIAKSFGNPFVLPEEEMELMAEKFKTYGQRK